VHDHRDVMARLAAEKGWKRGVELGVGRGLLLRRFLAAGIEMVGVDMGARPDRQAMQAEIAAEYPTLCRMLCLTTAAAAPCVDAGWADFVFIDAAHSYEAVKKDIALWQTKVRAGGWFGGHDYHSAHPGVIRAVDEAFADLVEVLPFSIWAVRSC
jgi:hypothetical protein